MTTLVDLQQDLEEAERCLDYLQGLRPWVGVDEAETQEVANRRRMAVDDVRERIKEIKEEIEDAGSTGGEAASA